MRSKKRRRRARYLARNASLIAEQMEQRAAKYAVKARSIAMHALRRARPTLSTHERAVATLAVPPLRFAAPHFFAQRSGFFYLRAAVRVDASGNVLDLDWLDLVVEGVGQHQPSVAYGGGRYLFTWCRYDDDGITIHGRTMRPDGMLEGAASFAIPSSGEGLSPSVEWNGERFVVSWLSLTGDGVEDVHVTLVDPSGSVVPRAERAVSTSGRAARPVITSGVGVSVVAWDDANGDERAVRAARVAGDGTVLDVGGVPISEGPVNARLPALASSGASFLVTWVRDYWPSAIRGAVLSADGTITARDFPISR